MGWLLVVGGDVRLPLLLLFLRVVLPTCCRSLRLGFLRQRLGGAVLLLWFSSQCVVVVVLAFCEDVDRFQADPVLAFEVGIKLWICGNTEGYLCRRYDLVLVSVRHGIYLRSWVYMFLGIYPCRMSTPVVLLFSVGAISLGANGVTVYYYILPNPPTTLILTRYFHSP